ncbi:MAG: hypothetical protein JXK07_01910 [Spirochaetes bacterium]|nr:hypothetical protein [Spirochaetota bacterium]MBN2769967.1 hypothetical protein [Spirochaetota bacterium]
MKFIIMNLLSIFVGVYFFVMGIKNIRNEENELRGVIMALGIVFLPVGALLTIAGIVNLYFMIFK